jgi:uncharacterized membrane protein
MTIYDLPQEGQARPPLASRAGTGRRERAGRRSWAPPRTERHRAERLARALGWLSIGLGLAEIAAPRAVARAIGVGEGADGTDRLAGLRSLAREAREALPLGRSTPETLAERLSLDADRNALLRLFGLREIGTGLAIFAQPSTPRWLWARVLGDVLDLAFLAFQSPHADRRRLTTAATAVAGVTALDVLSAVKLGERHSPSRSLQPDGSVRIVESIAVNRSPSDCYAFWRNLPNLSRILGHLEEVEVTGERTSRWRAKAPAGTDVEWSSEITRDDPGQLIVWSSIAGSGIENDGSVRFQPGPKGRGTLVRVSLRYRPPAGAVGTLVAQLFGKEPEQQLRGDLRRFKQFLETGEVLTTEGQPAGLPRGVLARSTRRAARPRGEREFGRGDGGATPHSSAH